MLLLTLLLIGALSFVSCRRTQSPSSPPAPFPTTTGPGTTEVKPGPTPQPPSPSQPQGNLKVHFIDVGQGDAILIDLADVEVLIDGGDRSPGVVNYLNAYVDGALEVMVATHTHADHIGGLIDVLVKYDVSEIWLNGDTATSKTYTDFMNLVNAENANVHRAERGNTIQVGTLAFRVLNPKKPLYPDANNNSIVLSLSYGDVDFLFMGDAESEAEGQMLVQSIVPLPDCEILKVGHHGSRTASSSQFLNLVKPDVAVYSCKVGNTYGHPHQETITALNDVGAKIYGTDVCGTVLVSTDGRTYEVLPSRTAAPIASSSVSTYTPTPAPTQALGLTIQQKWLLLALCPNPCYNQHEGKRYVSSYRRDSWCPD